MLFFTQAFNNETDHSVRMNKIFGVLNSVKNDSLKANIEIVEDFLKSWGASSKNNGEDIVVLKRENAELKKNYKDLKQTFLASVPNPREDDFKGQVSNSYLEIRWRFIYCCSTITQKGFDL